MWKYPPPPQKINPKHIFYKEIIGLIQEWQHVKVDQTPFILAAIATVSDLKTQNKNKVVTFHPGRASGDI